METSKSTILFDGICNLCNGFVQFVIQHDSHRRFQFAALQSDAAQVLLRQLPPYRQQVDSIVLVENGRFYQQSTAALHILRHLSGPWPILYGAIILPRFLRDWVYNLIAKNRYRWFGQRDSCMLPTPELKARFL
jgi:predicted DCC family thiol-disulfide oxidoreductase YuxK